MEDPLYQAKKALDLAKKFPLNKADHLQSAVKFLIEEIQARECQCEADKNYTKVELEE